MARNKISDLRDHLFAALERIDNDELSTEDLNKEMQKAEAVAQIGNVIINSAKVEIDFMKASGMISSDSALFKDIKVQGNMTQLFLIFNKKITDLQLVPVISADIDENEPWIYAIDFETTEDGQYMIDFTGDKAIYDRFSQFLKLQYEIVDKEDLDNFKINVVVYGYKK